MARLCWITDPHLDFVSDSNITEFLEKIKSNNIDMLLITGDISNANLLERHLKKIESHLQIPIYFVLGNHDFYGSSIRKVEQLVRDMCFKSKYLTWLNESGIVHTIFPNDNTVIIGHGGWYDCQYGDYKNSRVELNDFYQIKDFIGLDKNKRLDYFMSLADEASASIGTSLNKCLERDEIQTIYIATHVPPFRESSVYAGKISDDNWAPYFTSKCLGDRLVKIMKRRINMDKDIIVLTGHSHGEAEVKILDNLTVKTGKAVYYYPQINGIFDI